MLNIQNNYSNSNVQFGSKIGTRLIRNLFFSYTEKTSMDIFTKNMNTKEKDFVIRNMAHRVGFRPVNMLTNLISNLYFKLI
ncbi:hypothetical protein J6S88_00745 [bacterium]|nr:hypothetical protein [bacterium]